MAGAQSKRQSRKRRRSAAAARGAAKPRGPIPRPAEAHRPARSQGALSTILTGKTYGERPPNPFGGLPVSELAIFAGAIAVVVGLIRLHAHHVVGPVLLVGIIVVTLGVVEFSVREHFSGYRAHTNLLAGIPAVAIGLGMIALVGGSLHRVTLLFVVVPVFAVLFWILRRRFRVARQARLVKPPAP